MNIPVFVVAPRLKETSEATKITMISLAMTDIFIGILSVLRLSYFAISERYYIVKDYICVIDGIVQCVLGGVSATTIMYLCIDRVITIKYPLQYPIYFTKKVVTFIHVGIWFYVTLMLCLGHFVFGMEIGMMKYALFCSFIPKYQSLTTLVIIICVFVVPASIIFSCALILYHIVHQQIVQIRALEVADAVESGTQNLVSHLQAIKTIFLMVAAYYTCFTPAMVLIWIWSYMYGHSYSPTAEVVTAWFAFSCSLCNPLVYLPTMREYRETFKQIFIPNIFTT